MNEQENNAIMYSVLNSVRNYTRNEVFDMLVVKGMDVRDNFKSWCEKVIKGETLIISRPKNQNVVMISEKEYNKLTKAKHNLEYLEMLNRAEADIEAGNVVVKTMEELEQYEK